MTDQPQKVDLSTPDIAATNRESLEALFPGVIADGVLDAIRLGELLDIPVTAPNDGRERFGLMWAGKQEAVRSLLTPSRGTLVPDFENSIDFDTALNVFIEGDNLEVLKLLQKAYNDKVKLIYIDPPYNTGNDFVYNDDFSDGLRGYLEYTGQLDEEGNRTTASADTSGRRHSKWLSMMYPRLVLARNLLTQDGVIFVSIDDNEVSHLSALLDEIFGSENRLAQITVVGNLKGRSDDKFFATAHSFLLVYRRSDEFVPLGIPLEDEYVKSYGEEDNIGRYRLLPLRKSGTNSRRADRPNLFFPLFVDPKSGSVSTTEYSDYSLSVYPRFPDGSDGCWRWGPDTASSRSVELQARQVGPDRRWDVYQKDYLHRDGAQRRAIPKTVWTGAEFDNGNGTAQIKEIFGDRIFDGPKPTGLVTRILETSTAGSDLILDFFAGSGTTGHAVALLNDQDGGSRRVISVNLPEPVRPESAAAKAGFSTVAEITLARLRWIQKNVPGGGQTGLRTLKLGGSGWRVTADTTDTSLFDLEERTLAGEPNFDALVVEVLLKEGVTLDAELIRREVVSEPVVISDGVAVVQSLTLSDQIVDAALKLHPRVIVFFEDGFAGKDAVKTNAFTRARQLGITMKTI